MIIKKNLFLPICAIALFLTQPSCKKHILDQIEVTPGTFTDPRDGHVYKTTSFGGYTWLAENLDYATDSGSCYYDNNTANHEYGRLYSFDAAQAAVPPGWHLPTRDDVFYLVDNFGRAGAAYQAKETGTTHWIINYSSTTNYTGLTFIPGGKFDLSKNQFSDKGHVANFWENAYDRIGFVVDDCHSWIDGIREDTVLQKQKNYMYSVRCVKN